MAYDVVVAGLGGMGSAALAHLARRGRRVLGVEQFAAGHEFGASSGRSRIIRKAYFEDPAYVPLVLRAYDAWRALERATGAHLLHISGVLMAGQYDAEPLAGARESARRHGLMLEDLDRAEMLRRFPMFAPGPDECGVYEADGGFVVPEAAIEAQLGLARDAGAEVRFETRVARWSRRSPGGALLVEFADGGEVECARLALCAGPWLAALAPELGIRIVVQRNVQLWFEALRADVRLGTCPVFLIDRPAEAGVLYGFPDYGCGVKAAFHGFGERTAAETLDRNVRERDIAPVRAALERWMPGAAGRFLAGKACMYARSPDGHFIVGALPSDAGVVFAGGFSGHGFKFAPVIGEIVADLAERSGTAYDIGLFSPLRFKPSSGT